MASGKKGKKTKGKTLALTDFLQETTGSIPVQPIRKSNINWADEVEDYADADAGMENTSENVETVILHDVKIPDEVQVLASGTSQSLEGTSREVNKDGYDTRKPVNVVLPTAPKASRDYEDISEKVPKEPPYIAYLSNLPYDVDEEEISLFFKNMKIASMRIPKDDRDTSKLKGFGYVEFEDRDSLLNALVIPDTTLKSRRIRIEVAANSENDRRRGRMDMGRDRGERSESFGDWRSGPRSETSDNDRRGGFNRGGDREGGFTRDNMRGGEREERSFSRDNMRGSDRDDRGFSRDNMRDRDSGFSRDRDSKDSYRRDRDALDDKPGGWRDADRTNRDQDRAGFTRDRGNFRDTDRGSRFEEREERRGFGGRRFDNDRDRNGGFARGSERESEPASSEPRERRKLVLAPRTKPVESVPVKTESVPSASIFGSAKPVDTSQREREIEEKLAKEHVDKPRDGSKDRKPPITTEDAERKNIERSRPSRKMDESPKRNYEDKKPLPRNDYKSPDKSEIKHKPEKPKPEKRERHEKEMPKFSEPEPPNFAANNKFAFLQTEDISD